MNNTDGGGNTAIGLQALFSNTIGNGNVASGTNALLNNDTGGGNTAIGSNALTSNIDGSQSTAVGFSALNASTGGGNVGLGAFAGGAVSTANNVICIGTLGANVDNTCYIGNIFNQPSVGGAAVLINSDNKLGTTVSSKRFKEEIKPMDEASEAILAFQPVTFHYKKEFDPTGTAQFGLVAEDVEKVNPDLVVRDKEGKPYSVRYDQVNAMLLNEFLKEHRKNEEQEVTIEQLKAEILTLSVTVKEHAAQIQKVGTQLQLSKPAAQTANNNQ